MGTARPRRRWHQFSLSSLFVVTTFVALVMSLVVIRFIVPAIRQRNAVAVITQNGGRVAYDWGLAGDLSPRGPAWLRQWIGADYFQNVEAVHLLGLGQAEMNAALEQVSRLPTATHLVIQSQVELDADGLALLSKLDQLSELILDKVTDATVVHLAKLRKLRRLHLYGTISPDAIVTLVSLSELRELTYNAGQVTNILASATDLGFSDMPIPGLLDYFEQKYGVKFQYENDATALLKTYSRAPLLTATDNGMSLDDALNKLLTPYELGYRVEPQFLTITTRAEAERARAGIKILQEKLPNLKVTGW